MAISRLDERMDVLRRIDEAAAKRERAHDDPDLVDAVAGRPVTRESEAAE